MRAKYFDRCEYIKGNRCQCKKRGTVRLAKAHYCGQHARIIEWEGGSRVTLGVLKIGEYGQLELETEVTMGSGDFLAGKGEAALKSLEAQARDIPSVRGAEK